MNDWSISKRIGAITASLLGIVVVLSVVGVVSSLSLASSTGKLNQASVDQMLASEITEHVFEADVAEKSYRLGASQEDAETVVAKVGEVSALIAANNDRFSQDPELSAPWSTMVQSIDMYLSTFDMILERQTERQAFTATMSERGPSAREELNGLATTFIFDRNDRATTELSRVLERFLLGRVYAERFLLTNSEADYENANEQFERAADHIANVTAALDDESRLAQIATVDSAVGDYWSAFQGAHDTILARNELRAEMDNIAGDLHGAASVFVDTMQARQKEIETAASTTRNVVIAAMVIFSAVAVAGGFIFSRRVAGGVNAAITTSIDTMQELAQGKLDVEVTGTDSPNELGDIARALVVFRDTGLETKKLEEENRAAEERARVAKEAQAKREAEADMKRQRETEEARKAMITSLTSSLGSVVDAAAEGDFSRRIDARFDEPELDEMAESINKLMQNVSAGVGETARVMSALAEGDLTEKMSGEFAGMFAQLQASVNGTIKNLNSLVGEIAMQCDGLGDQAEAMTSQAEDLARRAEQQAASLEESSAVMEEMSASAKSSAEGANSVSQQANEASTQVEEAGRIVQNAVQAMADIRDASEKIGEIVSVIDGIAFQTNLLALNASVEAARAGSAGKGFAVVATEVRALAQRSGEASQDIKTLIEESTQQVARGVDLVEKTGSTLGEIVEGVRNMSGVMADLATTAHEQATGVAEASSAITQMDVITQKNATLADESRDTASKVRVQTEAMQTKVASFRTKATGSGGAARIAAE